MHSPNSTPRKCDNVYRREIQDLVKRKQWSDLISSYKRKLRIQDDEYDNNDLLHDVLASKVSLPREVIDEICALNPAAVCKRDALGQSPLYLAAAANSNYEVFESLFIRSWPMELDMLIECLPRVLPIDVIERYIVPFVADFVVFDQSFKGGWTCLHMLVMCAPSDDFGEVKKSMSLCLKCIPELAGVLNSFGATPLHLACFYLPPTLPNWSIYSKLVRSFPSALSIRDTENRTPKQTFLLRHSRNSSPNSALFQKYVKLLSS